MRFNLGNFLKKNARTLLLVCVIIGIFIVIFRFRVKEGMMDQTVVNYINSLSTECNGVAIKNVNSFKYAALVISLAKDVLKENSENREILRDVNDFAGDKKIDACFWVELEKDGNEEKYNNFMEDISRLEGFYVNTPKGFTFREEYKDLLTSIGR